MMLKSYLLDKYIKNKAFAEPQGNIKKEERKVEHNNLFGLNSIRQGFGTSCPFQDKSQDTSHVQ